MQFLVFYLRPQCQINESVGLPSLSFTDDDSVLHILFESSNDAQYGHLSHFAVTPYVSYEGVLFETSEHHYQYLKAVNFLDYDTAAKILKTNF